MKIYTEKLGDQIMSWFGKISVVVILTGFVGSSNAAIYGGGSGTEEDPYQIGTAEHLIELGQTPEKYDKCFVMTADIDLDGHTFDRAVIASDRYDANEDFEGTAFTGKYDGENHRILNLTIDTKGEDKLFLGFFGVIDEDALITNVCLENVKIIGSGEVLYLSGWWGGLCGENSGDIRYCCVSGSVTGGRHSGVIGGLCGNNTPTGSITCCYVLGSVIGGTASVDVGGFCGYNDGTIRGCWVNSSVTGNLDVGGFCGSNDGSIRDCWVSGSVTGEHGIGGLCGYLDDAGSISDSFSTGIVNGTGEGIGGLCGDRDEGAINNCFWDSQTSGLEYSNGGEPKTTSQLHQQSTFTNWDFINVWNIGENQTYPYLRTVLASDLNKDKAVNHIDLSILAEQWMKEEYSN